MLRAEVQGSTHTCSTNSTISVSFIFIYFPSAAVAVDSSHMTATSWSRFSPQSNFVNGHMCRQCGSWFVSGCNHRKVIG